MRPHTPLRTVCGDRSSRILHSCSAAHAYPYNESVSMEGVDRIQVPLPLAIDVGATLAPTGAERVHVKKRQATLQILMRADGKQGRLAIIFRGKGNISQEEKDAYAELNIDVHFQENKRYVLVCSSHALLVRIVLFNAYMSRNLCLRPCQDDSSQDSKASAASRTIESSTPHSRCRSTRSAAVASQTGRGAGEACSKYGRTTSACFVTATATLFTQ